MLQMLHTALKIDLRIRKSKFQSRVRMHLVNLDHSCWQASFMAVFVVCGQLNIFNLYTLHIYIAYVLYVYMQL